MLVAGFVDGHLIYIFEFSFNEIGFTSRLEEQFEDKFPNGDICGIYLCSADFSFKHYKDAKSLKMIHTVSKWELTEAKPYITGPVFEFLENNIQ